MSRSPKMTDKLIAELRDCAADLGSVLSERCRHYPTPNLVIVVTYRHDGTSLQVQTQEERPQWNFR
ncbi:MAG: hypothetical protein L0K63_10325 [Yaniella sp.]|nr:hypothetical protein [Yaniella sp.]MDN6534645.1 hypothetical protein [Yaniella sp.]